MAEPTLTEVFGANATQDANTLIISKADLAAVGLTPSATNRAEALLVALIKKWQLALNPTRQNENADIQITIEKGDFSSSIVFRNNASYRQDTYTINLQKVDTSAIVDPDDY